MNNNSLTKLSLVSSRQKLNKLLPVIFLLLWGASSWGGERPFVRYLLGRNCYGLLVRFGVLADPRKARVHRISLRNSLDLIIQDLEEKGYTTDEAAVRAKKTLLFDLGYDSSLVDRWNASNPKLLDRVLFNPDNKPITGYHGIRIIPESYEQHHKGFKQHWEAFYFAFQEQAAARFAKVSEPAIGIIERYQVPNFGWQWEPSQSQSLSSKSAPAAPWPAVSPKFASDPWLFVTHLKFPDYSDAWYPIEKVVQNGKLVLPIEIEQKRGLGDE